MFPFVDIFGVTPRTTHSVTVLLKDLWEILLFILRSSNPLHFLQAPLEMPSLIHVEGIQALSHPLEPPPRLDSTQRITSFFMVLPLSRGQETN